MTISSRNSILVHLAAVAMTVPAAGSVMAQQTGDGDARTDKIAPMPLADWSHERIYEGWYADSVIDRPFFGPHGDEIGEVKNLLLNTGGEIVALIAEVGGFLDIADTHITIPWREIERRDGKIFSPITADTVEYYGMFATEYFTASDVGDLGAVNEFFETGPHIWKATSLLDDYVVLGDRQPFGYVTDLVFDDSGKLMSVVAVHARGDIDRRGVYAFPWDDRGWEPRFDHYTLRHTEEEIMALPPIDYSEFDLSS